jgi:Asp-tRNA(Asn)/Glu-tRNA(Gln) amidotransferase A subunit family amidase
MQATLDRIDAVNPKFNAIVSLRDGDALLREADERDAQLKLGATPTGPIGWMHGIPQAIKDMAQTAGVRSTLGSPLLRDFVPSQDGLMVQRMKAAGCIVIGKTNVSEFGLGSHTFNEAFGITRNAYDTSKSAGAQALGASEQRSAYYRQVCAMFDRCDALALPSAQVWPFDAEQRWPSSIAGRAMDTYHRWMEVVIYATFAGLPCISVPVGFGPTGLPMGMQLIGRPRGDRALLRLAHAYERAADDVLSVRPPG